MLIPEDILNTLLCSECQQYLTVLPIKVYPNRYVRCGRCVKKGDNGVISNLYDLVIKNFELPCINRYAGCKQLLNYEDVRDHEKTCAKGDEYACTLCNDFKGTVYYLRLHLERSHSTKLLLHQEFIVELDKEKIQEAEWFIKENYIVILIYNYDSLENKNVDIPGDKPYNISVSFIVSTLEKKIIHQAKVILLDSQAKSIEFNIDEKTFPKLVAVCNFDITEVLVLDIPTEIIAKKEKRNSLISNLPVCPNSNCGSATFTFCNIAGLKEGEELYGDFIVYQKYFNWNIKIRQSDYNTVFVYFIYETFKSHEYQNPKFKELKFKIQCENFLHEAQECFAVLGDKERLYLGEISSKNIEHLKVKVDVTYEEIIQAEKEICPTCKRENS